MGCGNCGSGSSGKPAGCNSNGGCSTGGCNKMNVFDWLSEVPLSDSAKPFNIIEVSFNKGSRKDYFRNNPDLQLTKGDMIAVEGFNGFDIGMVNLTGELVKLQMKKYHVKDDSELKRTLRIANEGDLESYYQQKDKEKDVMIRSRAVARQMNLDMKIAEVELQADGKKATFFYTADGRVDFRELIRVYGTDFRLKVEMKQIGARQESGKIGGIGSCGRELCCSTWLSDFKSVSTTAARYQNLSINQTKLSGQCGRLKCCLNYELDTYMDALRVFPPNAESIETAAGKAFLQKRDIFKNLMWYSFKSSTKQYPIPIERVKEILQLNREGIKPEEMGAVELEVKTKGTSEVDKGFINDVGQLTLKSLEKSSRKNKNKKKEKSLVANGSPNAPQNQRKQNKPAQEGKEGRSNNNNRNSRNRNNRPKPEGNDNTPSE